MNGRGDAGRAAAAEVRRAYLRWFRRASFALLVPLALIGAVQAAAASEWWSVGPAAGGSARYLFVAVAIAGVVLGRNVRSQATAALPLSLDALASLSWRLLVHALIPVVVGAVLALMTRELWDFYLLLGATLVGLALLFPRYDQWVAWAAAPAAPQAASPAEGGRESSGTQAAAESGPAAQGGDRA